MDKKISNIKERIIQIADYKAVSYEKFFLELGVTYGNFKGSQKKTSVKSDTLDKIISKYPEINSEWLLIGKGEMLKDETIMPIDNEKRYPLVTPKAVAGFSNGDFKISEQDVQGYYVVPKFKHKKVDFMIEVEGSSMYPKYNSGDVIACRIINEKGFIQWNKTHVIATKDQGIIVKRIKESERENYYTMISDNKDYPPFEVPEDEIDGVALVVGVIRLE